LNSDWTPDLKTELRFVRNTDDQLTPTASTAPLIVINGITGTDLRTNVPITNGSYVAGTEQFRHGKAEDQPIEGEEKAEPVQIAPPLPGRRCQIQACATIALAKSLMTAFHPFLPLGGRPQAAIQGILKERTLLT